MHHVELIRAFIAAWNAKDFDPDKVVPKYLAEDASVRFIDSMPPMTGLAALAAMWKTFRINGETLATKINSVYTAGPVVVAHRVDTVTTPGKPDQDYEVVGVFSVKNGKIKEWIDYMITPL